MMRSFPWKNSISKHHSPGRGPGCQSSFSIQTVHHISTSQGDGSKAWRERSAHIGFFPQTVLCCWSGQETSFAPTSPSSGILPCFTGTHKWREFILQHLKRVNISVNSLFVAGDPLQMKIDILILILGTFPKEEKKSNMLKRRTAKCVIVVLVFFKVLKI